MKFLRKTEGCALRDRIRNEDIRAELNIYSMNDRIKQGRIKWKQHVERMEESRITKQIKYKPQGRHAVGRPRRRWPE